jgi:hypothetical protein
MNYWGAVRFTIFQNLGYPNGAGWNQGCINPATIELNPNTNQSPGHCSAEPNNWVGGLFCHQQMDEHTGALVNSWAWGNSGTHCGNGYYEGRMLQRAQEYFNHHPDTEGAAACSCSDDIVAEAGQLSPDCANAAYECAKYFCSNPEIPNSSNLLLV